MGVFVREGIFVIEYKGFFHFLVAYMRYEEQKPPSCSMEPHAGSCSSGIYYNSISPSLKVQAEELTIMV